MVRSEAKSLGQRRSESEPALLAGSSGKPPSLPNEAISTNTARPGYGSGARAPFDAVKQLSRLDNSFGNFLKLQISTQAAAQSEETSLVTTSKFRVIAIVLTMLLQHSKSTKEITTIARKHMRFRKYLI